jgi:AAA15 family ATPase/GTPase
MENMIYLLNMTVSGIKNIKKDVRIDFYKKTVDKQFNPEKYRIKAIYGENGAGKSAIITAVKIFQDIITHDNYFSELKTQTFLDEIINKTTQKFRFCCEYLVSVANLNVVYNYSIEIGRNDKGLFEIQSEILKTKSGNYANNNYSTIFASNNGELSFIESSDKQKIFLEKKSLNLLSSHSFIYIYIANTKNDTDSAEIDDKDASLFIHILMCLILTMSIKVYIGEEDQHELFFLRQRLKDSQLNNQVFPKELNEYRDSSNIFLDVNEKKVEKNQFDEYKKKVEQLTQFIKIFKPELVSMDIDTKENGDYYECELNLNYGDYCINKEFESTGIKKLIRLFDCFWAASTFGIVFIDEMDSNLNDVYLCKLIEYFMYYGKGQLCFTTHNLDPMTVLKGNKNSIDFLSSDNHLVPWTSRGNAKPENCYKNGMIEDLPFNIDATDFIGIFGE